MKIIADTDKVAIIELHNPYEHSFYLELLINKIKVLTITENGGFGLVKLSKSDSLILNSLGFETTTAILNGDDAGGIYLLPTNIDFN